MDYQTEKFIINTYIDTNKLLDSLNIDVRPNGSMYCPFHDNTHTPAAHLYETDTGGANIFCYAEHRLYTNYDIYKILMPNIDTTQLAQALFDRLSEEQKQFITENVNKEIELPELPYIESLRKFKKRQISYEQLLKEINLSIPQDNTSLLMDRIYNLPSIEYQSRNKYIHFMSKYQTQYKVISAFQTLMNDEYPEFVTKYLNTNGDCLLIPNIINGLIYSLTFRSLGEKKQFLKIGNSAHVLYNLGNLPKDFKYGTPIILVEGNLDCDMMKEIYPYTLASLTADITKNQAQLLEHLTDKVIVAYDNDEAGMTGYYSVKRKLPNTTIKKFIHAQGLHDLGDLAEIQMRDPEEFEYLVRSYNNQIQSLL